MRLVTEMDLCCSGKVNLLLNSRIVAAKFLRDFT